MVRRLEVHKLTTLTKVAYCLPLLVRTLLLTFVDANLTKFYLEDLCKNSTCLTPTRFGLVSSLIGTLGLFIDIFISYIVDRFHATFHSHLPMIMLCAPLYSISIMALFYPITIPSIRVDVLTQLSIWFTLFSVIKNVIPLHITFGALGSKLTKDCTTDERDSFFAFKQYVELVGSIMGSFLPFILATLFTDHRSTYLTYIFIGSILLFVSYFIMFSYVRKVEYRGHVINEQKVVIPIIPGLKQSFRNRAYQVMLSMSLFEAIRGLLWSGLFPFFFTKVLALDDAQYQLWGGIYNIVGMILASLFTPFWQMMSRRYGFYYTWLLSYILQVPIGVFVYLTIEPGKQQVYRYFVFFVLMCITGRASGFLYDSVKASMFDYDEFYTGERREASIEASLNVIPKYISLASNSVSFGILSYFNNGSNGTDYSPSAVKCIAVQTALLPSLTSIIVFLIMYMFPIDDIRHDIIKQGIQKHKLGQAAIDPVHNVLVKAPSSENTKTKKKNIAWDHFFSFEQSWFNDYKIIRSWFWQLQLIISLFWAFIFVLCGWLFINKTVYDRNNDTLATVALWLASVSFTLLMFF
jgi:Na+/melibiose symporter-like transporter